MPRITPFRLLKVLTLPWIVMIGMWFFLPSPVVPPQQRGTYIQNGIASGRTVITALDYMPFRKDAHSIHSGECSECSDLLIHWRVVKSGHDILLRVSDYNEYGSVNMTGILRDAADWNDGERAGKQWMPYFSPPLVMDGIPGGDTDEEINMPWFHVTDQKLVHYNMHNNYVSVVATAVVPEPGVVQIWRGAYVERALISAAENASNLPELVAYDYMMLNRLETDFLASFQIADSGEPVIVRHLAGSLPSRTYPIRRALLVPLGPFIAIPFILIAEMFELLSPFVYFMIVCLGLLVGLVCYRRMLEGGPIHSSLGGLCWPVQFIVRRQRKNRSRKKHVWGPTGPVDSKKHRNWLDEEKEVGLRRPETVRLGRAWKD